MSSDDQNIDAEITASVGHKCSIEFEEAAGGGYLWSCDPCENVAVSSEAIAPDTHAIGGGISRKFTMVASRPGDYVLTFRHKQPWVTESAEIVRLALKIKP